MDGKITTLNSKWIDAINDEIFSLNNYNTFKDHGNISYLPDYTVKHVYTTTHTLLLVLVAISLIAP